MIALICFSLDCGKVDRLPCPPLRRCLISAKKWQIMPFEEGNQNHTRSKAADVREIGNAAIIASECIRHGDELAANPYSENNPGWQVDESDKDDDQQKGADGRLGM